MGDADAGGADIEVAEVAVLVVASVRCKGVEVQFDVNGVG